MREAGHDKRGEVRGRGRWKRRVRGGAGTGGLQVGCRGEPVEACCSYELKVFQ